MSGPSETPEAIRQRRRRQRRRADMRVMRAAFAIKERDLARLVQRGLVDLDACDSDEDLVGDIAGMIGAILDRLDAADARRCHAVTVEESPQAESSPAPRPKATT